MFFRILISFFFTFQNIAFLEGSALNPSETALIIVNVQNDFCAGGSLAVPFGDEVIPAINDLREEINFTKVFFSLDWHPQGHISFYERFKDKTKYPGAELYKDFNVDLGDGKGQRVQRLWPVHCVENTTGAALRIGLTILPTDIMILKGTDVDIDSYSSFSNNDGTGETELDQILKNSGIKELVVVGLSFEYCVGATALDGVKKGYNVTILEDATGFAHNPELYDEDILSMRQKLKAAGVKVMSTEALVQNQR